MNVSRSLRILVVEDEEVIGADLVRRLQRFGHRPAWARSWDELTSCLKDAHDLILSRPSLEGGRDVLDAVAAAARSRGIPLLVLASVLDEALIERASVLGVWRFILYPCNETGVRTAVALAAAHYAGEDFPYGLEAGGEGILIIEDERIVALDEAQRIKRMGYKVVGMVPSAEEGIESVERLRPALVTTGIMLSGDMDGIEGAKALRKRFSIPLIYITGYIDDRTLERVADTRPDDFILKPFKERGLLASMRLALDRQSRQGQVDDPSGIFAAARRGGPAEVSEALGRGGDPSARDPGGMTPLMYAARFGDRPEVLTALLDAGAAIDAVDGHGRTALMHAMANASSPMCRVLLERGSDFATRDAEGLAVLDHWRLGRSGACALSQLYRAGLDPRTRFADGRSVIAVLLDRDDVPCGERLPECFRVLREAGVEMDRSELPDLGPEVLASMASLSGESLPALAAEGVDAAAAGEALLVAVHRGDEAAVRALLAFGADPECLDAEGRTPLAFLWRTNGWGWTTPAHAEVVALLAEAGGRLDRELLGEPGAAGLATFAEALPERVAELVAPGAVEERDDYAPTALMHAAKCLGPRAVECLLALGANPLAESPRWESALDLARSNPALTGSPALGALRRADEKARLGSARRLDPRRARAAG